MKGQPVNTLPAIEVRNIPNDLLHDMQEQFVGMYIDTDFEDHRGRMVSGKLIAIKPLPDGSYGVQLERYLDGEHVRDGARISSGEFMAGRPFRTSVHIPENSPALAAIDAKPLKVAA